MQAFAARIGRICLPGRQADRRIKVLLFGDATTRL